MGKIERKLKRGESVNTYIIEHNRLDRRPAQNELISGRTLQSALEARFIIPLRKIPAREAASADVVVVKGKIDENGNKKYTGRAIRTFYIADLSAMNE